MMSRDTGAKTLELLKLKIKDINLTTNGTEWYGEIPVNGKTGPRTVPMFHSVPYYKKREWKIIQLKAIQMLPYFVLCKINGILVEGFQRMQCAESMSRLIKNNISPN